MFPRQRLVRALNPFTRPSTLLSACSAEHCTGSNSTLTTKCPHRTSLQARQLCQEREQEANGGAKEGTIKWGAVALSLLLAGTWIDRQLFGFSPLTKLPTTYAFSGDDENDEDSKKSKRRRFSHMNFVADIVEHVSKSVVFLESEVRHPFLGNAIVSVSSGSGFLVDKVDGVILTNAHVIANTKRVKVKLNDGRVVEGSVEFINDYLDLATVRIPAAAVRHLDEISLGNSKQSRAGEFVIAVGAPLTLSNTVTFGIISACSRGGRELGMNDIEYIQTDASINVGNSGGPLVNLDGEAIGINTLKVGEGISFAVPSDYCQSFLLKAKQLRHQHSSPWWGGAHRPSADPYGQQQHVPVPTRKKYLGLTMVTLSPSLIEQSRARNPEFPNVRNGVLIYRVVLGSPAHIGGIQTGDIILSINGKEVKRPDDVYRVMESSNEALQIRVRRRDEEIVLRVEPQIIE